jgi:hypothetical protein
VAFEIKNIEKKMWHDLKLKSIGGYPVQKIGVLQGF